MAPSCVNSQVMGKSMSSDAGDWGSSTDRARAISASPEVGSDGVSFANSRRMASPLRYSDERQAVGAVRGR
jgi:hypothetical protein